MTSLKFCGGTLKALLFAVFAFVQLGGATAQAQSTPHRRTVVLRLDFEGSVNETSRDQLARRLFEGLASAGFQVFSADDAVARLFQTNPRLKACEEATCFMQMAAALQANFLIVGRIEAKRRDYDIRVRLIDGRTGEVLESANPHCDVCGIQEASDTVNIAASQLRGGLDKVEAPAQVTFETRPSGALVESDGQPLGFTPLTQELLVGVHQLTLSKPGYKPVSRSIQIQPGSAQSIELDLAVQPGPFLSPGWRTAGWLTLSGGVAAMAVGGYLLALDGKEINCSAAGCADQYDFRLLVAALLGGGSLLTGFGGLVVFVAPGVVQRNTLKSDAGNTTAFTGPWQLNFKGSF